MDALVTCTRRLTFEAGHRLVGHENRCAHLHGHSWKVWITAHAARLDAIGRVVDFSVLKANVGQWIETHWDHAFILGLEDDTSQRALALFYEKQPLLHPRVFLLPHNPTCEYLAVYLLETVCPLVLADTGVTAVKVVVQETENCTAEAVLCTTR